MFTSLLCCQCKMCSSFSQGQNHVLQPTLTVSAMALSHQSFLSLCLIPTTSFTTSFPLSIWTWASHLHLKKKKKLIVPFWVSPLRSQDILYSPPSILLNLWVSILHPLVLITSFLNIHQWLANHKAQLRMAGFCPADSMFPPWSSHPMVFLILPNPQSHPLDCLCQVLPSFSSNI